MAYRPHITDAPEILSDDEILALMPKNFVFITKLIGIASTLSMIEAYGGSLIFIPSKHALNIHHDITTVIGLKNLQILAEHFGCQNIEVPMGASITTHMRNRLIQQAVTEQGMSKAKAARKYNVTIRTARSASKAEIKPKDTDRNLDLFE